MAVEGARGMGTKGIAGAMWGSDSGVGWVVEDVERAGQWGMEKQG